MNNTVKLTYDSDHHVTACKEPQHKIIGVDCPYTGDGEEFSPANLLCVSLGSCMLLSLGYLAARDHLDLSGTELTVSFKEKAKPFPHVASIDYVFDIPREFGAVETRKIRNSVELCPIKSNIGESTKVSVTFNFGVGQEAA